MTQQILAQAEMGMRLLDEGFRDLIDEVTYPAHILLRYDLETAMVAGDLPVAELPGAFADGMRKLLGVEVLDDGQGCLQDVHWFSGDLGYFPTYTLGAMAAAQLFEAACRVESGLLLGLAQGDFAPLRHWLRRNVHSRGSLPKTDELEPLRYDAADRLAVR